MMAKIFGTISGILCLSCMSGFDCPSCNFGWQLAATIITGIIAVACLAANHD